jgi:hypothetical protein
MNEHNVDLDYINNYTFNFKIVDITKMDKSKILNTLKLACAIGDKQIIKDSIINGIDVTDSCLLENASYYGYYDIVKMLLENGSNPISNGCISLVVSKARNHYDVYNLLNLYMRKQKLINIINNVKT